MTRNRVLTPLLSAIAVLALVFVVSQPRTVPTAAVNTGSSAQLVLRTAGDLFHAIRNVDGTWSQGASLLDQIDRPTTVITHLATATVNGELHVLVSDAYGVYDVIRHADGTWAPMQRIGSCARVVSLAAATVNGELQVLVAIDGGAGLYTSTRHADSTWTKFSDLRTLAAGLPATVSQVTAAGVGGQLHVVVLGGGKVLHTVRTGDSWSGFGDVLTQIDPNHQVGTPSGVTAAGVGDALQVLVTSNNGTSMWHAIRDSRGNWGGAGDAMAAMAHQGTLISAATASVNGEFQAVAVSNNGTAWFTVRHANGVWDPAQALSRTSPPTVPSSLLEAAIGGD